MVGDESAQLRLWRRSFPRLWSADFRSRRQPLRDDVGRRRFELRTRPGLRRGLPIDPIRFLLDRHDSLPVSRWKRRGLSQRWRGAGRLWQSLWHHHAGGSGYGGTVFELSPFNDYWNFNLLYSLIGGNQNVGGAWGTLVMDAAGNLYGTTANGGIYGEGAVFKLTPSNGGWTYTSLHDFVCQHGWV